jgi:Flp pilus assembly protein TadG
MTRLTRKLKISRRGVITVLAAVMLVILVAMIAFAVDLGYVAMARTQLQAAADATALAAAANVNQPQAGMIAATQYFGSQQAVAGRKVQVNSNDILYGNWDVSSRTFTQSSTPGNAMKVTVRTDQNNGGQTALFFGRVLGLSGVNESASAVATVNPRDIAFVIDLSGSMNDDTQPDDTSGIDQDYPGAGTRMINQVYGDLGWATTYPNEPSQYIGQTLSGVTKKSSESTTLSQFTSTTGPLSKSTIPSTYRILSTDSSSTRTKKAYSWLMDVQVHTLMPAADPTPNSANTANYNYWKYYIDNNWDSLGYQSYLQHIMTNGGRDGQPGSTLYTPVSQFSSDCPWHTESTAGGSFSFPPREMPTHAARRAIIAALKVVKDRNAGIADVNQRDWVSIITFDLVNSATIQVSLTSNYDSAMQGCTTLQAVADSDGSSTATEVGLIAAFNHIKPSSQGGLGRGSTNKIVVLLTDGMPNLYKSSTSTISTYRTQNPSSNFYGGSSYYSQDAALMQTSMMQDNNWYLYPVGLGAGCDYGFMDRMARMGATADTNGHSPQGTGDPDNVENTLTQIFTSIITNPKLRLVK